MKCSFFRKIWRALFSCYLRFGIRLFPLLPTFYSLILEYNAAHFITSFFEIKSGSTWPKVLLYFFRGTPKNGALGKILRQVQKPSEEKSLLRSKFVLQEYMLSFSGYYRTSGRSESLGFYVC